MMSFWPLIIASNSPRFSFQRSGEGRGGEGENKCPANLSLPAADFYRRSPLLFGPRSRFWPSSSDMTECILADVVAPAAA